MTAFTINPKILDSGYDGYIHLLKVDDAMRQLRPDFRDSVHGAVALMRQRYQLRGVNAADTPPFAIVPVLYRASSTPDVESSPRRGRPRLIAAPENMTLAAGTTLLAWAIIAGIDEVPAINLSEVPDPSALVMIAAGSMEMLWQPVAAVR
jgi:hypothetical protein